MIKGVEIGSKRTRVAVLPRRGRWRSDLRHPASGTSPAPSAGVVCEERARKSQHTEPYRVLALDIKGCETLEAALENYICGEPISG